VIEVAVTAPTSILLGLKPDPVQTSGRAKNFAKNNGQILSTVSLIDKIDPINGKAARRGTFYG
jgi:hypothetical protein